MKHRQAHATLENRRSLSMYYATQFAATRQLFLFMSMIPLAHFSYKRYIENQIRNVSVLLDSERIAFKREDNPEYRAFLINMKRLKALKSSDAV
jgi:predicted GTPase